MYHKSSAISLHLTRPSVMHSALRTRVTEMGLITTKSARSKPCCVFTLYCVPPHEGRIGLLRAVTSRRAHSHQLREAARLLTYYGGAPYGPGEGQLLIIALLHATCSTAWIWTAWIITGLRSVASTRQANIFRGSTGHEPTCTLLRGRLVGGGVHAAVVGAWRWLDW